MTRTIEYPYLDFCNVVYELNGSHTTKIAEKVGCDHRTALLRLKFMSSKNVIFGEKRGPVWFWYFNDDFTDDDFISFLFNVELEKRKKSRSIKNKNNKLKKNRNQLLNNVKIRKERIEELVEIEKKKPHKSAFESVPDF